MPATKASPNVSSVFDQAFQNIRKTAAAHLEMQQELFSQLSGLWPGIPNPQTAWSEQIKQFQKQWTKVVTEQARKHREVLDKQYEAAVESLEEALSIADSTDIDDFRKRAEQLCRKTLDCLRELTTAQVREFQHVFQKWLELATKIDVK